MKLSRPVLTGLILLVMVCVVLGIRAFTGHALPLRKPGATGRVLGVVTAQVRIVEFTDLQCPACAKASLSLHDELKKNADKIFLEMKHFPLAMHKNARRAAVAAECALMQGKFWPMQDVLFASQKSWEEMTDPTEYFLSLGRGLGLDDGKMSACMADEATDQRVAEDIREGGSLGVQATPTFFVNGKMVIGSRSFQEALEEALK